MENIEKFATDLAKYGRNMKKMTPEHWAQKKYEIGMKKFKQQVLREAGMAIEDLTAIHCRFLPGDDEEIREFGKRCGEIMESDITKEANRVRSELLFQTFDADLFINASMPLVHRFLYEAYAPYWVAHCREVQYQDNAGWFGKRGEWHLVFWSDILDMIWDSKRWIWVRLGENISFRWGLAPMMDLIDKQKEKEEN